MGEINLPLNANEGCNLSNTISFRNIRSGSSQHKRLLTSEYEDSAMRKTNLRRSISESTAWKHRSVQGYP